MQDRTLNKFTFELTMCAEIDIIPHIARNTFENRVRFMQIANEKRKKF